MHARGAMLRALPPERKRKGGGTGEQTTGDRGTTYGSFKFTLLYVLSEPKLTAQAGEVHRVEAEQGCVAESSMYGVLGCKGPGMLAARREEDHVVLK